jgi:hypothetical protein
MAHVDCAVTITADAIKKQNPTYKSAPKRSKKPSDLLRFSSVNVVVIVGMAGKDLVEGA